MAGVKKSIYLDADLDEALRASARADGRSVTKQIDYLLRERLLSSRTTRLDFVPRLDLAGPARPDPKLKSKKLK